MKFTDGFWQTRPGVSSLFGQEVYDVETGDDGRSLVVTAPTKVIAHRGDTLNRPVLTVGLSSPMEGVIAVEVTHFAGGRDETGFDLVGAEGGPAGVGVAEVTEGGATLSSGRLTASLGRGGPFDLVFRDGDTVLTRSGAKSVGYHQVAPDARIDGAMVGAVLKGAGRPGTATDHAPSYVSQQLSLGVGELVYGLGERFGPLVKNGQTVDVWNADGGTSSEQAYKNVPFHLTNRGYGVLVDHPGHVSYEIGSESVERVQFSVAGETLRYLVIAGPTPADVLDRYTRLTGRPAHVPAWSYGLWLSTSFTTDYDEETVTAFVDEMAARDMPISVFHFDCFWMREFQWCDFEWDPRVFPDPVGMLARLHERDLRVCVWINPYIGQRSTLFREAADAGYLVKNPDGSVWQWDLWQAGMALVDFTNPEATAWFQGHLRRLQAQGVDAFKTDFGERIPTDVVWHDGSDPERMHNWYTQLYNRAVFDVLEEVRGEGDAVVFARSATTGGQALPVHWGGDSTSTFESMAETLRGGLSLAMSGFSFWSHDIGGFEGMPDPDVYKRWTAFGLLSSHSRFHGSSSVRVPWAFDDEAVEVTRVFTKLKLRLMPYLYAAGLESTRTGLPVMRPMALAFPGDRGAAHVDTQYLLGDDLLVAPVFSADGTVDVYLPAGRWTNWFTGEVVDAGAGVWRTETHGVLTLPLYVREGAVIPMGGRDDRPDHDYLDGLVLRVFPGGDGSRTVTVTTPDGETADFVVTSRGGAVSVETTASSSGSTRVAPQLERFGVGWD